MLCREDFQLHANVATEKIIINNSFACVLSFYVGVLLLNRLKRREEGGKERGGSFCSLQVGYGNVGTGETFKWSTVK